ncbi:MAG: hypothetical protein J6K04_08300 [Lachnospiraceae bacterium]|nr:hypothetical protein [Lachnospiraceae bacterium]
MYLAFGLLKKRGSAFKEILEFCGHLVCPAGLRIFLKTTSIGRFGQDKSKQLSLTAPTTELWSNNKKQPYALGKKLVPGKSGVESG